MQSGKPCWFRIYYLEYVSLGSLAYVVLHENTSVCTSGLSTRKMQSPVLTPVEYFWEPLPWEANSAQQASKSDLHELSPQDLFLCWDTSSAFLYVWSCNTCPPSKNHPSNPTNTNLIGLILLSELLSALLSWFKCVPSCSELVATEHQALPVFICFLIRFMLLTSIADFGLLFCANTVHEM